jgi:hypothetical protein
MTTTTLARNGITLGLQYQVDGWYGYVNDGDYDDAQQAKLVPALVAAQEKEFDALLPDGCHWFPRLGEVQGPVGTSLDGYDLDALMEQASSAVADRYAEIEREVLGA